MSPGQDKDVTCRVIRESYSQDEREMNSFVNCHEKVNGCKGEFNIMIRTSVVSVPREGRENEFC